MLNERNSSILSQKMIQWRRMFHTIPELSNQEKETSRTIVQILKDMGVATHTFDDNYGVCAIITGKHPGPTIAFRADMDALPITETNDVPYKSSYPGVMHACGHDGHMAILLGLTEMFSEYRNDLAGTVKLVFQPAEESSPVGGASSILKTGILNDVKAIFGLHLWPDIPCGHIGIRQGPLMAASDRLTISLLGLESHAGQPHHGIDAITIASDVIEGLSHIMSRQLDPMETATISIGTIKGGERYNVIAKEVSLEGTVRTLGENVRKEIPPKVERLLAGITAAQGGKYTLDYQYGYPVLNNWAEPTELVINAAKKIISSSTIHTDIKPALTAEDFSNYLVKTPGAFFWLGCGKPDKANSGLHTSSFDMDEEALSIGVNIMYQTGLLALTYYNEERNPSETSNVKHLA